MIIITKVTIKGITYYKEKIPIGRNADGTVKYKQITAKTMKECKAKALAFRKNDIVSLNSKSTLGTLITEYIDNVRKPRLKPSSYQRYISLYKTHIKPSLLNNLKLEEIKHLHLQKFYNSIESLNTAKRLKELLNSFFEYCINADFISKNPQKNIKLETAKPVRQSRALTISEREKIIYSNKTIFIFAMYTGLRIGEVLALTHKDIDFKENTVNVNKSLRYMNRGNGCEFIIDETKTASSIRKVPLHNNLIEILNLHIQNEKKKYKNLGIKFSNSLPLFATNTCRYYKPDNVLKMLKRIVDCKFHDLKHTFCTMLAEQGVDIKTASVLMGHSDIKMTANIYTHISDKQKKKAIQNLSF